MNKNKLLSLILSVCIVIGIAPLTYATNGYYGEIVFAIDTCKEMQNYTFGAENAFTDALQGIIDEAPNNYSFGFTTNAFGSYGLGKQEASDTLQDIVFSNSICDISDLIDSSINNYVSNHKYLFVFTDDYSSVADKIDLIDDVSIYPIIFTFDEIDALNNMTICQNANE